MEKISMYAYEDFIKNVLETKNTELYDNGTVLENLNYIIYTNFGEYIKDQKNNPNGIKDDLDCVVVLYDNGITLDTESDVNSYLQDIKAEFLISEASSNTLTAVINSVSEYLVRNLFEIETKATIVKITNSHSEYIGRNVPGNEKLSTSLNLNFIVYNGYILSNDYSLYINDEKIPLNNITINRSYEIVNDGKKSISQKFLKNTSGLTVGLSLIYLDIPIINQIEKDICSAASFADQYKLLLKHKETELINDNFILSSGTQTVAYGSIVSFNIQFILASTIK